MLRPISAVAACACLALTLSACGPTEQNPEDISPDEMVYIEPEDVETALENPTQFEGMYIGIMGQVFNEVGTVDGTTVYQAYYDTENAIGPFAFGAAEDMDINVGDYVTVDGLLEGSFTAENQFDQPLDCPYIQSTNIEVVDYSTEGAESYGVE